MTTEIKTNEMSMEQEISAIRKLLEKVKSRVAEGRVKVNSYETQLDEIAIDLTSSAENLKNIKKSFSITDIIKAKTKGGISVEEARSTAKSFCEYADTIIHISDEQQRQAEVEESLARANDTLTRRQYVQARIEDLMDAIGDMD